MLSIGARLSLIESQVTVIKKCLEKPQPSVSQITVAANNIKKQVEEIRKVL